MTSDISSFKLGKAPAVYDPRTLKLANYIHWRDLPSFPTTHRDSDKIQDWRMLRNDSKGICVVSGDMHQEMLWSVLAGTPFQPNEQEMDKVYTQLSGGDNGLVILDYLRYRRKNPLANAPKMLGFAAVDWNNQAELSVATSMFRGVLRGILLPNTAKAQSSVYSQWDTITTTGDGRPGSWGGHLTLETDYDTGLGEITWGYVQRASRRFMSTYCDECYVCVPNYKIPGFDYDLFVQDLLLIDPNANFDPPQPSPVPPVPDNDEWQTYIRLQQKFLGVVSQIDVNFTKGAPWWLPIER